MEIELLKNGKEQIQTFLKIAMKISKEKFSIVVNNDQMLVQYIDPGKVSIGQLTLKQNQHVIISDIPENILNKPMEFQIKDILKVLSYVGKNKIKISLSIDIIENENGTVSQDISGIKFEIRSSETDILQKEVEIPIYDFETNFQIPKFNYDPTSPCLLFNINDLKETITELREYDNDYITFQMTKATDDTNRNCISFLTFDRNNLRKKINILKREIIDFKLLNKETELNQEPATYQITEYVENAITSTSAYEEIQLQYQPKGVLSIKYLEDDSNSNMFIYIAPSNTE